MDKIVRIIDILAWPTTIIIVVALLRSPLSDLLPTLKKLKYKDLELEFEREANKILSEAERDLPELPQTQEKSKPVKKKSRVLFCLSRRDPSIEILEIIIFSTFPAVDEGRGYCNSYMHLGQHGSANYSGLIADTKPATEEEYKDLKNELENHCGYNLIVRKKYYRSRK